jgi:glutamate/tyrosine decarboxylase-like PLP-dependent enzyme
METVMPLPESGLDRDEIFGTLDTFRSRDVNTKSGRLFARVYPAGERVESIAMAAYRKFQGLNGLDPISFPSLLRFETEIIDIVLSHLNADLSRAVGSFTSGGTESILCAVKAARDFARATRPEVTSPEVVLPKTAHAAFHKACAYFDLKAVTVAVDPVTFRADAAAMEAAITDQTLLIVASAPAYPHGTIDPIEAIGAVARSRSIPFHVDACVGGWLLPLYEALGEDIPRFDFRVPGVTSISVDLHKYALCPKGASVVLYADKAMRRYQFFACTEWAGYSLLNPTVQSTKSGGPLAGAWATLHAFGRDGYLDIARRTLAATARLIEGIEKIDDLELLGEPDFCMLSVKSDAVNVFHVLDGMTARGWLIEAQLAFDNSPENLHISLNPGNLDNVDPMLEDLDASVEAAKALGTTSDLADQVRSMFAAIDPTDFTEAMFQRLLEFAGMTGVGLPDEMAEINQVLNALPRPITKALLLEFGNSLWSSEALHKK